jgi:permease MlaE
VYSIIHETGPIVTGLVVSGRVGAGIGAELGSMKVTEQIDGIEASGVNLYKFLARAMVVRDYLVGNFSFDDSQLKTLGRGKGTSDTPDSGWGTVEIIVYPADTEAPTQTSAANPK